jgi:hypothetical protein
LKIKVKLQFYINFYSFQLTEIKMSLITSSAYPRQMTGANTSLWKTLSNQSMGSMTGTGAGVGGDDDQYEAVDRVFASKCFLKLSLFF